MADPGTFRDRLLGDLDERYDKLVKVIDDALEAKTAVWVNCPHCKKRSKVDVQDTRAAISAAEWLANQAAGRPGVDDRVASDEEKITFVRVHGGTDAAAIWHVAQSFIPADRLEEFEVAVADRQREEREGRASTSSDALNDKL